MAKQVFSVKGMHCSACVMTLEGLEDELAGIRSLKVSLHKQRAEIDYDEKKISEDEIRRAFERVGYGLARASPPKTSARPAPRTDIQPG